MPDQQSIPEKSRILIVDDDSTMRLLMTETLLEDGYQIDEVDNGSDAIAAIKASAPDMVLLDVKMPGMSGFEVCAEIRRLTGDTDISIVMVTGLDDSKSIEKAFDLGATAFITKPINWDTFPYRIQYLLKARDAIVGLKQRELHLEHTERISRILTQSRDKDKILQGVLHELLDIFSADRAFIVTSLDRNYTQLDIPCEALRDGISSLKNNDTSDKHLIAIESLHRADNYEYPLVTSSSHKPAPSSTESNPWVNHQMLKALHVGNSHAWFLGLHKSADTRAWSSADQETFYIIGLRLAGVLSRYLLMEKLHHSENLLRQAQKVGNLGNWRWDIKTDELTWSDELYHIYGYEPGSFAPTCDNFFQVLLEEDYDKLRLFKNTTLESENTHSIEHRILLPSGEMRWVFEQEVGSFDNEGNLLEVNGIVQDITDRIKKQEQEVHNHKMEAIGQLTSGVAHDFGNLMTIAKGNLELLDESFSEQHDISEENLEILNDARSAIEDSVELTKQLLTFSRKKSLAREYINVSDTINKFSMLFKNTLGDKIKLSINIDNQIPDILVDSAQFESSLLNLVINARNAMPDGGQLTINAEVAQEPALQRNNADNEMSDQTVCISISDIGTGMTDYVRQHAIEPFFTTRKNEGTGLGLSMVYGFMQQSEGELIIHSVPGEGTTMTMQFPVYGGTQTANTEKSSQQYAPVQSATILIVEDRPEVRQFAVRCLDKLGLNILEADNAASAQSLLAKYDAVDLLFTDILMPGEMNGRELAQWATKKFPGLKVLLTTAAEREAQQIRSNDDIPFQLLPKPYSKRDLLDTIRAVL